MDRPTVLIVEDHSDTLEITCLILDVAGFQVVAAPTATEALELVERSRVDAVVADIGLPDMDGYLFLRRLRFGPLGQGLPILAVTGWATDADRRRAVSAGASAVLAKPCEPFELVGTLRLLLGQGGTETR